MPVILPVKDKSPCMGNRLFIAENATIVGDVVMGNNCSVWFNAVIRGDVHYIKIGDNTNIQDGAIIHATYLKAPTNIGNNVSIGHNAIVHGCTLHDNVLIGMGAIVMDDAVVRICDHRGRICSVRENHLRIGLFVCRYTCQKNKAPYR
jgi:carbonic anhydrase/acetyltransferase-like protein (isoleucine patch superfamily)